MANFKKLSAYVDVPCEWVSAAVPCNDKIDQLEAENAKLREKVQRQADELTALRKAIEQRNGEWRPWKRQAERFVAENAKLRELCGEMLLYIAYPYVCVRPSVLVERARDLGIEVDG